MFKALLLSNDMWWCLDFYHGAWGWMPEGSKKSMEAGTFGRFDEVEELEMSAFDQLFNFDDGKASTWAEKTMVLACWLRSISFPRLYDMAPCVFCFQCFEETLVLNMLNSVWLVFCYFSPCLSVSLFVWLRVASAPRVFIVESERRKALGTRTPWTRVSYLPGLLPTAIPRFLRSPNTLPSTEIVANLPRIFATLPLILKWSIFPWFPISERSHYSHWISMGNDRHPVKGMFNTKQNRNEQKCRLVIIGSFSIDDGDGSEKEGKGRENSSSLVYVLQKSWN